MYRWQIMLTLVCSVLLAGCVVPSRPQIDHVERARVYSIETYNHFLRAEVAYNTALACKKAFSNPENEKMYIEVKGYFDTAKGAAEDAVKTAKDAKDRAIQLAKDKAKATSTDADPKSEAYKDAYDVAYKSFTTCEAGSGCSSKTLDWEIVLLADAIPDISIKASGAANSAEAAVKNCSVDLAKKAKDAERSYATAYYAAKDAEAALALWGNNGEVAAAAAAIANPSAPVRSRTEAIDAAVKAKDAADLALAAADLALSTAKAAVFPPDRTLPALMTEKVAQNNYESAVSKVATRYDKKEVLCATYPDCP